MDNGVGTDYGSGGCMGSVEGGKEGKSGTTIIVQTMKYKNF